jgi:hypothetical protein
LNNPVTEETLYHVIVELFACLLPTPSGIPVWQREPSGLQFLREFQRYYHPQKLKGFLSRRQLCRWSDPVTQVFVELAFGEIHLPDRQYQDLP